MTYLSLIPRVGILGALLGLEVVAQDPPLPVCDVLREADKHHAQVVRVRGRLVSGMEAQFLTADDCGTQTDAATSLNMGIWLTSPNSPLALNSKVVAKRSVQLASNILRSFGREAQPGVRGQVFLTVIGELHAKPQVMEQAGGKKHYIGYGHLGGQRAQIVVSAIHAVEIRGLDEGDN